MISFEKPWQYAQPDRFPTSDQNIQKINAVAPFWSDNDIRKNGTVRYVAIKEGNSTAGDKILANMNQFIQQQRNSDFTGKYAIIAQWDHVHPFPHGNSSGYNISKIELNKVCLL